MVDGATGQFIAREPFPGDLVEIQGVEFPRPILDLNRELISKLTGIEIKGPFKPLVGFRHVDGTADSPKMTIELKERSGIPLHVDCLGFGGAGVTLSWGAAIRVLNLVNRALSLDDAECNSSILVKLITLLSK